MKNILVTGGAGFIGSNLSCKLISLGFNVRILDNLSPQIHRGKAFESSSGLSSAIALGANFIKGTVTLKRDWLNALEGQDAVIHLAAETGTGQSMYEIAKYVDVNVAGTSLLLDILANSKHNVQKMIVASSRAIYGEGKYECAYHGVVYPAARKKEDLLHGRFDCTCPLCDAPLVLLPTDEESKICPTSVYGITKQTQEELVLTVGKSLGIPAVAFRYQNVYGPGQSLANPYTGILSIFSTRIKNGNDINIFEDGKESRDFVYIDDTVNATIAGLTSEAADFEAFNVGGGEPIDVMSVATLLKENFESHVEISISGNYRLGDIRHNYADLSKIRKLLGYAPQVSFEEGLYNFCNWVEAQEVHDDRYSVAMEEMKMKGLYK